MAITSLLSFIPAPNCGYSLKKKPTGFAYRGVWNKGAVKV
jgi:hypothetical protein